MCGAVWLRNALQAGTFEDAARRTPSPRGAVANAVYHTVRNSMKGQPEQLVERAILQARQEADLLYQFVLIANLAVLDDWAQRDREYTLLLRYLAAELNGKITKDRVEALRLAFLMFIEPVILLDAAIAQVAAEYLDGQPILFRDCEVKLQEQLQLAERLSKHFNPLADALDIAAIDLEELRNSGQSEADRQVSGKSEATERPRAAASSSRDAMRTPARHSPAQWRSNRCPASPYRAGQWPSGHRRTTSARRIRRCAGSRKWRAHDSAPRTRDR